MTSNPPPFALAAVPEIHFGPGRARRLPDDVRALAGTTTASVLIVADAALVELGLVMPLQRGLESAGAKVGLFADITGEPKAGQIDDAAAVARHREASVVVALGGGSALDIGKVAAAIARAGADCMHYALAAKPLPAEGIPAI